MIYERSCGVIVFRRKEDREFLLIKSSTYNHWSFPKGHVEDNETDRETAIREVKEETNLEIEIIDDFQVTIHYSPFKNGMKDVTYFIAEIKDQTISLQLFEVNEYCFLPFKQAFDRITFENEKEVLTKANYFLTSK